MRVIKKFSIMLIAGLFLLAGCGKAESLHCTKTDEVSGFTISTDQTLVINKNKMETLKTKLVTTADSTVVEFLDTYIASIEDVATGFGDLKNLSGVDFKSEKKDSSHTINIEIDYTKVKSEEINKLNASSKSMFENYDESNISAKLTKEELEEKGFACTLK